MGYFMFVVYFLPAALSAILGSYASYLDYRQGVYKFKKKDLLLFLACLFPLVNWALTTMALNSILERGDK